ncbi:MAG: pyridoxamine 5'-phosphate oxidase family protein [Pseudomonadota bacterium]
MTEDFSTINTVEELEAYYGSPRPAALVKVARRMTAEYARWIEASRFCALGTVGPDGLDVSPRGDRDPVVAILDETTLALPDRRGNDRLDSLRNVVQDPRVSLMFMVPGENNVVRVIGTGAVSTNPELLNRFGVDGALPRSVILVRIGEIYFQCARALIRSELWTSEKTANLPTVGEILAAMSGGAEGGKGYDRDWNARAQKTMW